MKCPICGSDVYTSDGSCPGCGNYLGNEGSTQAGIQDNTRPVYNMPYSQTMQYIPKVVLKRKRFTVILIVSVLFFMLGMIIVTLIVGKPKTYDMGSFSVTLPATMKEVDNSELRKVFADGGSDGAVYENGSVRFAYAVSGEFSKYVPEDQIESYKELFSTEYYINVMAGLYGQKKGYILHSKTKDTLKFNYNDDEGNFGYCHINVASHKNKLYIFFLFCNEKKHTTYASKFDEWIGSIKFK